MNNKKVVALVAGTVATATLLTSCGGSHKVGESYKDENGNKIYTYEFNMYVQDDKDYPTGVTKFDEMIKKDFGIEFTYDRIPRTNWETKTNTYFATNNAPDVTTGGKENNYKNWASKGYLQPIDYNKLPDWKALWSEEDLEKVISNAENADGKLYYLPSVRQEKAQMCWLYRKDVFDKLGLQPPSTIDEFYTVLKKLKEAYPDKTIWSANGGGTSTLTSMMQAYWMPELILQQNSYVDPVTKEFVPYALATDAAREMYKFLRKAYTEGLIDKEIMSIEKEQFYNRLSTGHVFMAYNYVYNTTLFNEKSQRDNPDANWTWSPNMITAYPEKGTIYKRDPLYSNWGPAFSTSIDSEEGKFDAILKYFNWCATDEGSLYNTYGIEGETFTYVNGVPTLNEDMYHESKNTKGTKLSTIYGSMGATFLKHPVMFAEVRGDIIEPLWETYNSKPDYYYFEQIPFKYTDEEETKKVDLETALNSVRDQYMAKFLMGEYDPNNDADWKQYLTDLGKVGLADYEALQKAAYEKVLASGK